MVKCGGCGKFISPTEGAKCGKCANMYHRACVNIPTKATIASSWHCPICVSSQPRDNRPSTPVRGAMTYYVEDTEMSAEQVNKGRESKSQEEEAKRERVQTTAESSEIMSNLVKIVQELKCEVITLRSNDSLLIQEISSLKKELNKYKELLKNLDGLGMEITSLKEELRRTRETSQEGKQKQPKTPEKIILPPKNTQENTFCKKVAGTTSSSKIPETDNVEKVKAGVIEQTDAVMRPNKRSEETFTRVTHQKNKTVQRGQNKNCSGIKALEVKRHLHVWRLASDTTVEQLTQHVKSVCGTNTPAKIEKVKHKTERDYSSFVITVSERAYEELCQPQAWPVNTAYGEWFWFRRSTNNTIDKA